jgi:hypothetical protein
MLIIILWSKTCKATWSTDSSDYFVESFKYPDYTTSRFTKVVVGDTGNLYYFGHANLPTGHTLMLKYDSSNTQIWAKVIEYQPTVTGFSVSKDDVWAYTIVKHEVSGSILVQLDASDGSVFLDSSVYYTSTDNSIIIADDSGNSVFYTVERDGNGYICKWCPNSNGQDWYGSTDWIVYDNSNPPLSIIPITSNQVYLMYSTTTQPSTLYFAEVDYNNGDSEIWSKHIDCPDSNCDSNYGQMILSTGNDMIYAIVQYDSKNLFLKFSTIDINQIESTFELSSSLTWTGKNAIYQSTVLFYILSVCDTTYISVYDPLSDNFTEQFKLSSTTIGLFDLYISLDTDPNTYTYYIFGYWTPNDENAYIASAPTIDPTGHPHFESSSDQFVETTSYPFISDVITRKIFTNIQFLFCVKKLFMSLTISSLIQIFVLLWSQRLHKNLLLWYNTILFMKN